MHVKNNFIDFIFFLEVATAENKLFWLFFISVEQVVIVKETYLDWISLINENILRDFPWINRYIYFSVHFDLLHSQFGNLSQSPILR